MGQKNLGLTSRRFGERDVPGPVLVQPPLGPDHPDTLLSRLSMASGSQTPSSSIPYSTTMRFSTLIALTLPQPTRRQGFRAVFQFPAVTLWRMATLSTICSAPNSR